MLVKLSEADQVLALLEDVITWPSGLGSTTLVEAAKLDNWVFFQFSDNARIDVNVTLPWKRLQTISSAVGQLDFSIKI